MSGLVTVRGLNKYKAKSRRQKDQIKQGAANYIRSAARTVLRDLVLNVPQWSGTMAASWVVSTSRHEGQYNLGPILANYVGGEFQEQNPIRWLGDRYPLKYAYAESEAALASIRWNSNVSIVNTSEAADVITRMPASKQADFLRPGNYIPGDVMAVAYVTAKYKLNPTLLNQKL